MSLQLFKSSKSIKGVAASWNFNSLESSFFLSMQKQVGYSEETHTGIFKDGARIVVKFSIWEMGALISCLKDKKEYSFFHKTPTSNVSIRFAPYIIKDTNEHKGYGISVNKLGSDNKAENTWMLSLSFSEKETLLSWIDFGLRHCYSAIYASDKKMYKEKQESKSGQKPSSKPLPKTQSNEKVIENAEDLE